MSRASYELGVALEEMNQYEFQCEKAKRLGTIGKYVGNTTLFVGAMAYFVGWILDSAPICVISFISLVLGIICNVLLHNMAQKADEEYLKSR